MDRPRRLETAVRNHVHPDRNAYPVNFVAAGFLQLPENGWRWKCNFCSYENEDTKHCQVCAISKAMSHRLLVFRVASTYLYEPGKPPPWFCFRCTYEFNHSNICDVCHFPWVISYSIRALDIDPYHGVTNGEEQATAHQPVPSPPLENHNNIVKKIAVICAFIILISSSVTIGLTIGVVRSMRTNHTLISSAFSGATLYLYAAMVIWFHGRGKSMAATCPDALATPFRPRFDVYKMSKNDLQILFGLGSLRFISTGLSEASLSQISSHAIHGAHSSMAGREELTCPICLQDFAAGARVSRLPDCSHMFHLSCIIRWLNKSPSCPVCRMTIRELFI